MRDLEEKCLGGVFFPLFLSGLFLQNTGPNFHHDQDVPITCAVSLAFLAGMLHCPSSARKVEIPLILCSVEYRICLSIWRFPNSLAWRVCLWKHWFTCLFSFPQSNDYPTRLNYPCALFYMLFVLIQNYVRRVFIRQNATEFLFYSLLAFLQQWGFFH